MNSPYSVGGAKTLRRVRRRVRVLERQRTSPNAWRRRFLQSRHTHTHTHLYDCDCVTFGLQYTVPEGLGRQSETYAREESVMLLSACTVVRTVLSWKCLCFSDYSGPFFPPNRGSYLFNLIFFPVENGSFCPSYILAQLGPTECGHGDS